MRMGESGRYHRSVGRLVGRRGLASRRPDGTNWKRTRPAGVRSIRRAGRHGSTAGEMPAARNGKAHGLFRTSVSSSNVVLVPSGHWPDGTGGSPVPPIPTSEFALNLCH